MPATFLTGSTGFIGAEILRRILDREPERCVFALVRAADDREAAWRGREVLFRLYMGEEPGTENAMRRVRWIRGDLTAAGLGLAPAARTAIAAECDEMIHAAAATEWDLPLAQAEAVNVTGVRGVLDLAAEGARGGRAPRLVHVSTAYVAGRRSGVVHPEDLPGPDAAFNNTYEATKAQAERLLRERMGSLPITVVRPSIVVGDSRTGRTFNFNVLYFPIKLLDRGLISVVPGRRSCTLDVVPVDYVSDATLELGRNPACVGGTFNLTADDDAMTIEEFLRRVVGWFNERRLARGEPPLRPPRLVGPAAWSVLHWILARRLTGRARFLLDSFNLYRPYITNDKRFVAASTARALAGRVAYPPIASYLRRVTEYAVTREWGKDVSWDPSMMRDRGALDVRWRCANGHEAASPGFTCHECGARVGAVPRGTAPEAVARPHV
jgi:thioester reductase-like protein